MKGFGLQSRGETELAGGGIESTTRNGGVIAGGMIVATPTDRCLQSNSSVGDTAPDARPATTRYIEVIDGTVPTAPADERTMPGGLVEKASANRRVFATRSVCRSATYHR